ncbi:thiopurine S-methyltransferase [Vibrio ostreicida]|uniref:Thiopurine S-methyltransferase n=1 Tax=Vibrio ostreicida TaxID=526588 RepID=A0ABT8BVP0_9VIBR|nr:thiopurine S-methyltransferase [Vibrio ostreicida]MDN3610163.1 thiopurine S-methyltransferase [Vibrio ostreicida]NPD07816.1 thiopurine S-methyltransferase [Vibrio ostreicida]
MEDPDFWHSKWASNQIGFHRKDVNSLLMEYWSMTKPSRDDKVFVPLCGKSEDLVWLASQHEDVQAVELSKIAVRAFFSEHFYTPTVISVNGQHDLYQFDELSIINGDIFSAPVKPVDIIYDRAALVALPEEMRVSYVERIMSLLKPKGRVLLVSLDYPQEEMSGPPFSVAEQEIRRLFEGYRTTKLYHDEASENHPKIASKGLSRFTEEVYLIES